MTCRTYAKRNEHTYVHLRRDEDEEEEEEVESSRHQWR